MRDFADQTGDASVSDVLGRPGQRYVMMDIGGRACYCSQKVLRTLEGVIDMFSPN